MRKLEESDAITVQNNAPTVHLLLGNLHAAQGNAALAEESYRQILDMDGEHPEAAYNLLRLVTAQRIPQHAVQIIENCRGNTIFRRPKHIGRRTASRKVYRLTIGPSTSASAII